MFKLFLFFSHLHFHPFLAAWAAVIEHGPSLVHMSRRLNTSLLRVYPFSFPPIICHFCLSIFMAPSLTNSLLGHISWV